MTTICCVKCPDCECNPQQSSPSAARLLSLTDWPSPLSFARHTWCYLPCGGGVARTRRNNCPQPSPPAPGHLSGTEEHRVPAQSPKHVLGKQGDPMAKQPSESLGALLTKYYSQHKFVKPSGTSRLSFILSGFLCGPQLLTSHEKIQSVDARLLRYQPLALGGLESISPSSNASSTTCCL